MLEKAYRVFNRNVLVYWLALPTLLFLDLVGVREKQAKSKIVWFRRDGSSFTTDYCTPELLANYGYVNEV